MDCPDCKTAMAEGFLPDLAEEGANVQTHWHPGPAKPRTFLGMKYGAQVQSVATNPLTAFRCPVCGLLRLYALSRFMPKAKQPVLQIDT